MFDGFLKSVFQPGLNSNYRKMANGDIVYLGKWWGPEYLVTEADRKKIDDLGIIILTGAPFIYASANRMHSFWLAVLALAATIFIHQKRYNDIVRTLSISPYPKHAITMRLAVYYKSVSWKLLISALVAVTVINFLVVRRMMIVGITGQVDMLTSLFFIGLEIYILFMLGYKLFGRPRERPI